jgi:hypothetical protein
MFRFLLISFLIFYVLFKVGRFLFRVLAATSLRQEMPRPDRGPASGRVHVDREESTYQKNERNSKNKGEYIDFEEVK